MLGFVVGLITSVSIFAMLILAVVYFDAQRT